MVNAADFVGQKNIIELAKKNFKPKKNSVISLVRLACHHHEVKDVLPLINWLKKSGYKNNNSSVSMNVACMHGSKFEEVVQLICQLKHNLLQYCRLD